MKAMTGEIGKLSQNGEQIGGFKYWTVLKQKNPPQTKVVAQKFWFFKDVKGEVQADFYSQLSNKLKLIYSKPVTLQIPEHQLNQMTTELLLMDLGNFDWSQ